NSASAIASEQITVTMQDNCSVPIEDLTSASFSLNPGETATIQVTSNTIPSYAYIGQATATVILVDSTNGPVNFETVNFYIDDFTSIIVTPSAISVAAGNSTIYSATAFDPNGNGVDVTSWADWSTGGDAGGSWLGSTYSPVIAGLWSVTASLGNLMATGTLNVTHASAVKLEVSPQDSELIAGQNRTFTATAYDAYGNAWAVTN